MVSSAQPAEIYTTQPGDTWFKISRSSGMAVDTLKKINGATSDTLSIGQTVKLKSPDAFDYTVLPGDTLWVISKRTGLPVAEIKKANGLTSDTILAGQILKIPSASQIQQANAATTPRTQYTQEEIKDKIRAKARELGVDENLALAVAEQESKFNQNAKSKTGAAGIFQLTFQTANGYGVKDRYNADENIAGGIKYLKWCIEHTSTEEEALVAYNRGLTSLNKAKAEGKEIDSITDKCQTEDGRLIGYAQAVAEKKEKYAAEE